MSKVVILVVGVLLSFGICPAGTFTLDFTEMVDTVVDSSGLIVTPNNPLNLFPPPPNVTLTFTGGLYDAIYGVDIGTLDYSGLSGSALIGPPDGMLTIDFATSVSSLKFALGFIGGSMPGFEYRLSGQSSWTLVNTAVIMPGVKPEVLVTAAPGALIDWAEIRFLSEPASEGFALDNLTFDAGASVPEPAALCLVASG